MYRDDAEPMEDEGDNGEGGGSLPSYSMLNNRKRKAEDVLQKVAQSVKNSREELNRLYDNRKKMKMSEVSLKRCLGM